ncbi:MAG: hypothetical protein ACLQNE_19225 [Thermoguttaceae bacterium]
MGCFAKYVPAALFTGLMLQFASCGRGGHAPAYPVTGKVLFKGKPAEGAQVTFIGLDEKDPKSPKPGAQVKKNGVFRLSTFLSYDGAPAGRYAVTVVYRSPLRKVNDENTGPDLLRGRYADAKTTPLKAEIKTGNNELEPFDLQ